MRKYLLLLISAAVLLGVFWSWPIKLQPQTKVEQTVKQQITLILDFGQGAKRESRIGATTAFEALQLAAQQQNLELKTKQYDFGIFVESIGGIENSKEQAWIYFVNGKVAEVASDKYLLKAGDVVEWKYIKPSL